MRAATHSPHDRLLKACACLVPAVCMLVLMVGTRDWPVISDATLMHYVLMLLRHGEAPYRQIVDINMPGAYAVEWAGTHLFGDTALGWRLLDICLMVAAIVAMASIAGKGERYAGLFAGLLFALVHGSDGVAEAGQRDFCIAILLLTACAFVFCAVRQGRWHWMLLFGLASGAAVTIKPTAAPFAMVLLGAALAVRSRQRGRSEAYLAAGVLGLLLPSVFAVCFLWRADALRAFWHILRGLLPYHAAMARHTPGFLLLHTVPGPLLPLALFGGILFVVNRSWVRWERLTLLGGLLAGFVSYYAQGKAYPYHRYPMLAFLLLLAALEFAQALSSKAKLLRTLAITGFSYGALWLAPASTAKALRYDWRDEPSLTQLQQDLAQRGGPMLSGRIQCMDTMAGCITVLDRMRLIQTTGFLYDCYFFAPERSEEQERLRSAFLSSIRRDSPRVFVLTDQFCFNNPPGYSRLTAWPAFNNYLKSNYELVEQRAFTADRSKRYAAGVFGYRIYVAHPPLP